MPTTEIRLDKTDRTLTIYSSGDVEPILEHNKMLRTMEQDRKSDLRHFASIPPEVCLAWLNDEWKRGHEIKFLSKEWDELVAKKLADPGNKYLLTGGPSSLMGWNGKVKCE